MTKTKPYKGKSLANAARRIRQLEKQVKERDRLLERWDVERKTLAMLAAEGPAFDNPLLVYRAKQLRDEILLKMNMKPDGSFLTEKDDLPR